MNVLLLIGDHPCNYLHHIDVCTHKPVCTHERDKALRVSPEMAATIATNFDNRPGLLDRRRVRVSPLRAGETAGNR
jgi:hypothetical protein